MENENLKKWLKDASDNVVPKMRDSSVMMAVVTKSYMTDPMCALQIGLAIMMNKPILLIIDKNEKVPESLIKIAKLIERVDTKNEEDLNRASLSVAKFAKGLGI